ncbi:kinase-like protein [Gigaspora margarita]|uniref:Kinase-like protein n=1 Tax=Gigaspora margarita TaxID=4874 RepID=A0A8H4AX10_GIGMA|nr:kinase-like protein [Gigaspora margarita]
MAKGGSDTPEDVLGDFNAATHILIHIDDAPPHGRFNNFVMMTIIQMFLVFNLMTMGYNPEVFVNKFCKATSSPIFSSITLISPLRNSKCIYSLQKKKTSNQYTRPDWTTHPEKTGKLLCCIPPRTLAELKTNIFY